MKRFIGIVLTGMLMMFFGGCGVVKEVESNMRPDIDGEYSAKIKMIYGEDESEAAIQRMAPNAWQADFLSPETLAGVCLTFAEGNVSASYKGLSFSVPKSAVPIKSMLEQMFNALDTTSESDNLTMQKSDNGLLLKGKSEVGDYVLKFDADTGAPIGFEMPGFELTVDITDFTHGLVSNSETSVSGVETALTGSPENTEEPEKTEKSEKTDKPEKTNKPVNTEQPEESDILSEGTEKTLLETDTQPIT
ncbi:MAG: hypothetical protein LBR54_01850 [Oscillospiraceae bacterium]|jgi:hypothetical protein|nr:hypothetical protein [Oscillospiraceae bacterium]